MNRVKMVELKVVRFATEKEFPLGKHTAKIEVVQTEGKATSCGIYLEMVNYKFHGGYVRVGEVVNGTGEATHDFVVESHPTAPEGPVYVIFRIGVGTFDPYDYTARFRVRFLIDGVEIFSHELDMRTVGEVIVTFRGVAPPTLAPPVPDYMTMGLGIAGALIVTSIIATWTHEQGWWKFPWE